MIQTVTPTERDQTTAWTLEVVVREASHGMRRLTIDCPESVAKILADTWGLEREDGALRGSHLGVQIEVRSWPLTITHGDARVTYSRSSGCTVLRLFDGSWHEVAWFNNPWSAMSYLGEWYWSDWGQIIEDYEAQP